MKDTLDEEAVVVKLSEVGGAALPSGARAQKRDGQGRGAAHAAAHGQDRYGCSDKRLFRYLDSAVTVAVTTLEGEVFTGKVAWMGRWEFGLKLEKSDVEVVFWRHALADIAEDK